MEIIVNEAIGSVKAFGAVTVIHTHL